MPRTYLASLTLTIFFLKEIARLRVGFVLASKQVKKKTGFSLRSLLGDLIPLIVIGKEAIMIN